MHPAKSWAGPIESMSADCLWEPSEGKSSVRACPSTSIEQYIEDRSADNQEAKLKLFQRAEDGGFVATFGVR